MKLDRVIAVRNSKTVYRDGDRCIKVFNAEYSKADILNEALNQAIIEETSLNIPKIIEISMIDGKWAIISEYIKGKTLAQLIKENENKKDEYLELFVDLHVTIHQQKCHNLNKLREKISDKIAFAELESTTRYDLYNRLENMPKHNKVCHGDFNPSNVIITEDGTPYILDWSHATQGNASADAARTYFSLCLNNDVEYAKKYLDLFCKKSNIDKGYVQKWLPIVAASQSVKSNEKEREFLLSWENNIDKE